MTLDEIQKKIYANIIAKNFNVTDIPREFCYLYGEVGEAYEAWHRQKGDYREELADVAIYLLGLCEILEFSLHDEIQKKMAKNEKRIYENVNGVPIRKSKE